MATSKSKTAAHPATKAKPVSKPAVETAAPEKAMVLPGPGETAKPTTDPVHGKITTTGSLRGSAASSPTASSDPAAAASTPKTVPAAAGAKGKEHNPRSAHVDHSAFDRGAAEANRIVSSLPGHDPKTADAIRAAVNAGIRVALGLPARDGDPVSEDEATS